MKKTIHMKLSPYSIEKAIKELQEYKEKRLNAQAVADRLIKALSEEAMARFEGKAAITPRRISDSVWEIEFTASGTHRLITFLEFGTGVPTLDNPDYAESLPIKVYAGSWSEEHGHTYEQWQATNGYINGKYYEEYPYNLEPMRGIFYGMEAAREELSRIMRGR